MPHSDHAVTTNLISAYSDQHSVHVMIATGMIAPETTIVTSSFPPYLLLMSYINTYILHRDLLLPCAVQKSSEQSGGQTIDAHTHANSNYGYYR